MAPGNVSEHDLVLDVRSFQLIRSGERLKLENTPMELLTLLARRRGELVTREEIISAIWGGSIHVDAEAGINTAIRKIRQALRDDPTAPKFIETVVGKGYRFIGPIEVLEPGRTDSQARHSNETYQVPRRTAIRRLMLLVAIAILAGSFLYFWRSSARQVAGPGKRLVIAFIPFRNLSMEPGQDYFVDGMSDEILAQLGQINPERLRIVRYAAPDAAEGTPTNAELSKYGCQYVLKGSVRRSGEQARITAVLVRLADGSTQWTRSFDRPTGDFLVIQTEIAQQIGHELQIQVLGHANPKAVDPEAIEMYLHGRFELSQLHAGDAAKSYFERAIAADPSYAPAYAGLADLYRDRAIQNDRNSGQAWLLAEEYSKKALALANDSAESNAAAAQIALMHEWNWAAARQYALRALQFNPSLPEAHAVYARYLSTAGETAEALNQRKEAAALDPFRPDLQEQLAREYFFARDFEKVVDMGRQKVAKDSNDASGFIDLCHGLGKLKMFNEAAQACAKSLTLEGRPNWANSYLQTYRTSGFESAERLLGRMRLQELLRQHNPDLWELASAQVAAGMKDSAFVTLNRGLQSREPGLVQLRADPDFDSIRNDPRYDELIRAIGYPNQ